MGIWFVDLKLDFYDLTALKWSQKLIIRCVPPCFIFYPVALLPQEEVYPDPKLNPAWMRGETFFANTSVKGLR